MMGDTDFSGKVGFADTHVSESRHGVSGGLRAWGERVLRSRLGEQRRGPSTAFLASARGTPLRMTNCWRGRARTNKDEIQGFFASLRMTCIFCRGAQPLGMTILYRGIGEQAT